MTALTFVSGSPTTLRHLERALRLYLDQLRRDGYPAPPDLLAFLRTVQASSGQERPKVAAPWHESDGGDMSLTVTYEEAGRMLSCSERTVRRLVASGTLPVVEIGPRTRRLSVADIRKHLSGGTTSGPSDRPSEETVGTGVPAPRGVPEDRGVVSGPVLGHPPQQEIHA